MNILFRYLAHRHEYIISDMWLTDMNIILFKYLAHRHEYIILDIMLTDINILF